jgi:hypothetical protein
MCCTKQADRWKSQKTGIEKAIAPLHMGLFLIYNGEENGRIGGLRCSFHHLFSVVVLGDVMIGLTPL